MQQPEAKDQKPTTEATVLLKIQNEEKLLKQLAKDYAFLSGHAIPVKSILGQGVKNLEVPAEKSKLTPLQNFMTIAPPALFIGFFTGLKFILASNLLTRSLFPLAALFDIISLALIMNALYNTKNRQLNQYILLTVSLLATTAVTTAVTGAMIENFGGHSMITGMSATSMSLVPWLFVGAIGLWTVYNLSLTVFHAVMAYQTSGNERNQHLAHTGKALFQFIKLSGIIFAILGLMALPAIMPAVPIALVLAAKIAGASVLGLDLLITVISTISTPAMRTAFWHFIPAFLHDFLGKPTPQAGIELSTPKAEKEDAPQQADDDASSSLEDGQERSETPQPSISRFRIFYVKDRSCFNNMSLDKQKNYLVSEINAKLTSWEERQDSKHVAKRAALTKLKTLINNNDADFTSIKTVTDADDQTIEWNRVCKSTFRDESDTAALVKLATLYLHSAQYQKIHGDDSPKRNFRMATAAAT